MTTKLAYIAMLPFSISLLAMIWIAFGLVEWLIVKDFLLADIDPVKDGPPPLIRIIGVFLAILWFGVAGGVAALASYGLLYHAWKDPNPKGEGDAT